jgi:hypothetical protein
MNGLKKELKTIPTLLSKICLVWLLSSMISYAAGAFDLKNGWNLVGNSSNVSIHVATTFGSHTDITSIWKWNRETLRWAFYAPAMAPADLAQYTQTKGFEVLESINSKEGFWVNSKAPVFVAGPNAAPANLAAADLQTGWNLVSTASGQTPSQLNAAISRALVASGRRISTVWAWDNNLSKWRFFSPELEEKGGSVLSDYAAAHEYLPFLSGLIIAEGFWVNAAETTPSIRDVPFSTPVRVLDVNPLLPAANGSVSGFPIVDTFQVNLTGAVDGAENVVLAGRHSQPFDTSTHQKSVITVMGWQTNSDGTKTLVDQTAQWFTGGVSNVIEGTEPSVKFADLNNDGVLDMMVAPSTDTSGTPTTSASVFFSNGSTFSRTNIPLPYQWAHGSTIAAMTADNTKQDLVFTAYGTTTAIAFNDGAGNFSVHYQAGAWGLGGSVASGPTVTNASGVAAADFTTNYKVSQPGQKQLVFTDETGGLPQYNGAAATMGQTGGGVYTWYLHPTPIFANDDLVFTKKLVLPPSPFAYGFIPVGNYGKDSKSGAAWSTFNFGSGNTGAYAALNGHAPDHVIRAVTYDFNNDGWQDIVTVSRPWATNSDWPNYSEVQFIQNNGTGTLDANTFADVTDTVRVGYDTASNATYNPQFIEGLFGVGSKALLLSAMNFNGSTTSQILLQTTSDGSATVTPSNVRWVRAYPNVLSSLEEQAKAMNPAWCCNRNGSVNIIKGPDSKLYFLTYITYNDVSNILRTAVYASEIGMPSTVTAPQLYNAVQQNWPYMSPGAVNPTLANSSADYGDF